MFNRCYDMNQPMMGEKAMPENEMFSKDMGCCENIPGRVCPPVYECPKENVCHREIIHEVPHICPCNTRIINHHIYRHCYKPTFSCCEENVVCNVYDNKCCF